MDDEPAFLKDSPREQPYSQTHNPSSYNNNTNNNIYSNTFYNQNRRTRVPPSNNNNTVLPSFLNEQQHVTNQIDHFPFQQSKHEDNPVLLSKLSKLTEEIEAEKQRQISLQSQYESELSHKDKVIASYKHSESLKDETLNQQKQFYENEIPSRIKAEQERLDLLHKNTMDTLIQTYEAKLQSQQSEFESQKAILSQQLSQQIKLNPIALQVQQCSNEINSISNRLLKASNTNEQTDFDNKNNINALEAKLRSLEIEVTECKGELKLREEYLQNELQFKTQFHYEEIDKIKKGFMELDQLQSAFQTTRCELKEQNALYKMELNKEYEKMKMEVENAKAMYQSKVNELDSQRKIFEEEKDYFTKYKSETLKAIDEKVKDMNDKRNKYLKEENDIKNRIQLLENKEYIVTQKYDDFDRERTNIEMEKEMLNQHNEELIRQAKWLEQNVKEFNEEKIQFNKDMEEYLKNKNEFDRDVMKYKNDLLQLKQQRSLLQSQIQRFENAKAKCDNDNYNYNYKQGSNRVLINNNNNNNGVQRSNNHVYSNTNSNKFNADDYYNQFQHKLNRKHIFEEHNNMKINNNTSLRKSEKFNEMFLKEKEFVKQSRSNLENSIQMDKIPKSIPRPSNKLLTYSDNNTNNNNINNNDTMKVCPKEDDESKIDTVNFYNNKHSSTMILNE